MIVNGKGSNKSEFLDVQSSLIIFVIVILFSGNIYFSIFNSGGSLYIKLLNLEVPLIKNYNIDEKGESAIILNPLKVLGMEVGFFNVASELIEYDEHSIMAYEPFELNDASIEFTPEEEPKEGATVSKAFNSQLKKTLDPSKAEVLIYHTHEAEQFMPKTKDCYEEEYSIVGVGNELEKELEAYGISVIHDKTKHCTTSYNDSYIRSGETLNKYLNQYGNKFKLIIDLHRDGTSEDPHFVTNLNNENIAKIMFVNAKNSKFYEKNNELVNQMREISNKLFPGFSRGVHTYNRGRNAFNQDKSEKAILIEVGSQYNTIEEAKSSTKYIARIIAEQLNKKVE